MNIIFLGTPQISAMCLSAIIKSKHKVLAVVTKPDKPVGRGGKIQISPVKELAQKNNLPVLQFNNISKEGVDIIKKLKPDALVLVAFGQILSPEILSIALPINLHGSLLPNLLGPSPIQTAIIDGLKESGVSVMVMEPTVDTGDIILQKKIVIEEKDTSATLFEKMGEVGSKAIVEALDLIENKKVQFIKQNHDKATYTQLLTKENAIIDFNQTTMSIVNKIRGYNPSPVAYFIFKDKKIKVYEAENYTGIVPKRLYKNGEIVFANSKQGLIVKTNDGFISLLLLQAPNSKILKAKDFVNGYRNLCNQILNS